MIIVISICDNADKKLQMLVNVTNNFQDVQNFMI